jgi:hypothetical protein
MQFLPYSVENSKYRNFLEAFSLKSNLKKLISTQRTAKLSCLCGLRVLTLFWVIFGHSIEWTDWTIYSKYSKIIFQF